MLNKFFLLVYIFFIASTKVLAEHKPYDIHFCKIDNVKIIILKNKLNNKYFVIKNFLIKKNKIEDGIVIKYQYDKIIKNDIYKNNCLTALIEIEAYGKLLDVDRLINNYKENTGKLVKLKDHYNLRLKTNDSIFTLKFNEETKNYYKGKAIIRKNVFE